MKIDDPKQTMSIAADPSISPNTTSSRRGHRETSDDELSRLKLDLLKAEVRLAKARAGVASAEADVRVLGAKLKVFTSR
jgi:hypothetical protein